MRRGQDASEGIVIAAGGLSLRKALKALWLVRKGRGRGAEAASVAYQDGIRALVLVVLGSGAVELVLVDVVLSVLWMRLLALALGLLGLLGLLSFISALRAYPHQVAKGELQIHYGACFDLVVPMALVGTVTERRALTQQKRIAEVKDGVLSVPVMGVTNLALDLDSPLRVHLKKSGVATVREIRVFAVDPHAGAQYLRNGGQAGNEDEAPTGPPQRPRWARAIRWVGPLVLLVEIGLVTTGILDWRIATAVIAVTEGALTLLGVAATAALVTQYRRGRSVGRSKMDSLTEAFFFLMPASMAGMVRRELSFLRVLALGLARRTEGAAAGDMSLGYGATLRRVTLGLAVVLLAAGVTVLTVAASSAPRIIFGCVLLYAAVITTAAGIAGKVRPHVLRDGNLLIRWGLHQEFWLPLRSVRSVDVEQPRRRRRASVPADRFQVPASGRRLVVLRLSEAIEVPTRFGRHQLAESIALPVDDAGVAESAITAQLHPGGAGSEGEHFLEGPRAVATAGQG